MGPIHLIAHIFKMMEPSFKILHTSMQFCPKHYVLSLFSSTL